MSYQTDREQFIATMSREGLPLWVTRRLLREATGINRRAELACSSEAADRDRVACPSPRVCLCDQAPGEGEPHVKVPRIAVQGWHAEQRIVRDLPAGWAMVTEGDPRGYTLRVIPPSYAERNQGRDRWNRETIGVPAGPSGLRF